MYLPYSLLRFFQFRRCGIHFGWGARLPADRRIYTKSGIQSWHHSKKEREEKKPDEELGLNIQRMPTRRYRECAHAPPRTGILSSSFKKKNTLEEGKKIERVKRVKCLSPN